MLDKIVLTSPVGGVHSENPPPKKVTHKDKEISRGIRKNP